MSGSYRCVCPFSLYVSLTVFLISCICCFASGLLSISLACLFAIVSISCFVAVGYFCCACSIDVCSIVLSICGCVALSTAFIFSDDDSIIAPIINGIISNVHWYFLSIIVCFILVFLLNIINKSFKLECYLLVCGRWLFG